MLWRTFRLFRRDSQPMSGETRIGILGGSFDPVHLGHLLVAQAAREELHLDRLIFVPASRSPFKPEDAPVQDQLRLRMLRLALAGLDWCEVCDLEIRRSGLSYTVDTVRELRARMTGAKWFLLIGEDHLSSLDQWREVDQLKKWVEFAVVPRPDVVPSDGLLENRVHRLVGWPIQLSSSIIRERVRKGLTIDLLVPRAVAEVIRDNRLYLE